MFIKPTPDLSVSCRFAVTECSHQRRADSASRGKGLKSQICIGFRLTSMELVSGL
jgi:hypothetical protein